MFLKARNFGAKILKIKEILQKELIYNVAKFNKFVTPYTAEI